MRNPLKRKKTILNLIQSDPGVGFLEIKRTTGFAHGVLSHHLLKLERDGSIRIRRGKRKMWAFPIHSDPKEDTTRMFLRRETSKKILVFLLEKEPANFSQIQKAIQKSPSTTSIVLKVLVEKRLVSIIPGFPRKYCLKDAEITSFVVSSMNISQVDQLKDRFADTFSYL